MAKLTSTQQQRSSDLATDPDTNSAVIATEAPLTDANSIISGKFSNT